MNAIKPAGFKRPNFFVIGAEKAGTTSLYELMGQHPGVFFSQKKEPNFFIRPTPGKLELEEFESGFAFASAYDAVGEASTTYSKCMTHPGTAARIAKYAPDARIIYIVRDPLLRVESQWIQRRSMSIATPRIFSVAIREDRVLLDASLYWLNLETYRKYFDDSRILLLFLEDLKTSPHATLETCFRFLQLDPNVTLNDLNRPRNTASEKREDGGVLDAVRRIPLFEAFRDRFIPQSFRQFFKPMLQKPICDRPIWNDATRFWFLNQIASDNAHLLEFAGKPANFWNLHLENNSAKAA